MTGGVGETIASAVVKLVAEKLGGSVWTEIGVLWNVQNDLDQMKETLLSLQAVVKDAEMRALKKGSESERIWLQKVKSAVYDIEDALNDFEVNLSEKMDRPLVDLSQKVMIFFSSSNQLLMHIIKAHKMKSIRERLDKIEKQKRIFKFKVDGNSSRELEISEIRKRETFSKIEDNHEIVGRNHDKENVINLLLENDPEVETSILPIFGLGGLGKTTLAQLVFNDERVRNAFNLKAWVYVSIEFDLLKIGKSIISQFDGRTQNYDSLQDISNCLSRLLENKKCLIILDDMWEEDIYQLERLKLMLKGGARGSIILVTTRSQKVSGLMATENIKPHNLMALSDNDCWFIFSQRAFKFGGNTTLVDVGKEIAKKCKGIPLAAKALGYIMQSKEGTDAWLAVRDSDIWQLEEDNILPSLKLSYYCMPPSLKLCFMYCAIFAKGCELVKDELIQQWIALGLFSQPNPHFTIEEKGEEHIESLLSMSFLEYSSKHGKRQKLLHMHDLVHDLVRAVAGEEVFFPRTTRKDNNSVENHHCRYALLTNYNEPLLVKKALWNKVRALNFKHCSFSILPSDMFLRKRFLRILDLSGCCVEELPDSIGMLKQMRFLDISKNPIQLLPKSISNLRNMSALSLSKTHLKILPSYVSKLQKLRYLNLHGCYNLQLLPESISDLVSLVDLDLSDCCNLQILPESFGKMCKLKILDLSGCSELPKLPEFADEVDLSFLDLSGCSSLENIPQSLGLKLKFLYISGCSKILMLPKSVNSLAYLEILDISYCSGINKLPDNFDSNCNLQKLDISGCSKLITIPSGIENIIYFEKPFGSLAKIKSGLVECRENIVGGRMSNTIVRLEHQNETKEVLITHIENVSSRDEAEKAKLCNKSKLRTLTLKWSDYNERLVSNNKPQDESILEKLQPHRNLENLKIDGYSSIGFSGWVMNMAIFLSNLVKIDICNLAQCVQLPPLGQLPNLEVLNISNVPNIKEMDFIVCGGSQSFAKLRALSLAHLEKLNEWSLCGCSKQKNLPQCSEGPALLEEFRIYNCPSMGILPWNLHALTSLKELDISDSTQELAELCKEWVHFKHSLRPMLHIKGTKSFYYQTKEKRDLSIIENLVIESVDDLDMLPLSLQGLTSLRSIEIRNCPRLERVPEWIGYIATLEELFITGCNSLDSMPRSVLRLVSSGEFTSTYCDERQGRLYLRQKEMVDSLETS